MLWENPTDGTPVSVLVTQNLKISDVVTETIYADFTEMEKQLARLEGVELFNYTDNTRVVVEERLGPRQKYVYSNPKRSVSCR